MNTYTRSTLLAVLVAAPGLALATTHETEPNDVASAQELEIVELTVDGKATTGAVVNGVIGVVNGTKDNGLAKFDIDFFKFTGKEGDVVTLDIDGGMGGPGSVDTNIALYSTAVAGYPILMRREDVGPVDPGSTSTYDARIVNFRLPYTGVYVVGVSGYNRQLQAGAKVQTESTNYLFTNGDYTLIVSGVTPPLMQISIDIKPGSTDLPPMNPKSRGKIPVALLGSAEFSVDDVDTETLTFGRTGAEESFSKCGSPSDVNGDLWPDMVCHFENQSAAFAATDEEAILRGSLDDGRDFEGRGWLKVVPAKGPQE